MADKPLKTYQIADPNALAEIGSAAAASLDTIFSDINTRFLMPLSLSFTGSSLVATVGPSIVTTGPYGKQHGMPIASNADLGTIQGTLDFSSGTGSGQVQNTTLPSMTAGYWIRAGFEIRPDKKIYVVFGTQQSSQANAAASGAPAFTASDLFQIGEVYLQDNGTGGTGNFITPTDASIIQYASGSGGGSSSASSNIPLKLYAAIPATSALQINPARMTQSDGTIIAAPVIDDTTPNFGNGSVSTIDFQSQSTTGGSFSVTWPSGLTVSNYVLATFSLLSGDIMEVIFSAQKTSIGLLPDPASQYDDTGVDCGYLILQVTNSAGKFKTAGSSSNIIEDAPGGTTAIFSSELYPPRAVTVSNYDNIVVDPVSGDVVSDPVTWNVVYT